MDAVIWGVGILFLIAASFAVYFVMQAKRRDDTSSLNDNTYALQEIISPAHRQLLFYLEQAFNGHVVLFRPALSQLVQLRVTNDRIRSQALLDSIHVDYVVCDDDGRPHYAFAVRQRGATNSDPKLRNTVRAKAKVLKSVGVKLLNIQRSVSSLPPVGEFAHKLSIALGEDVIAPILTATPMSQMSPSQLPPSQLPRTSQFALSDPSDSAFAGGGLTTIMGLPPEEGTPPQPPVRRSPRDLAG